MRCARSAHSGCLGTSNAQAKVLAQRSVLSRDLRLIFLRVMIWTIGSVSSFMCCTIVRPNMCASVKRCVGISSFVLTIAVNGSFACIRMRIPAMDAFNGLCSVFRPCFLAMRLTQIGNVVKCSLSAWYLLMKLCAMDAGDVMFSMHPLYHSAMRDIIVVTNTNPEKVGIYNA